MYLALWQMQVTKASIDNCLAVTDRKNPNIRLFSEGRMFYFAESYITTGKIRSFNDIRKKVKAVDPLQIKKVSRKIFKFDKMCVACVGDIKEDVEQKIRRAVK